MTPSFANIALNEIKFDCRHYSGYKPCGKQDGCPECPHYSPRGEQILIIKLGAMGDVLRTKSLLPALKRAYPTSWIVWLTAPGSECIARDPLVDEVRTLTTEGIMSLEGRPWARILCLDKDPHALALSARLDAKLRQGFAPTPYNSVTVWNDAAMDALRLGLSDEFKFRQNRKTQPEILHNIAELPYTGDSYGLTLTEDARRSALEVLTRIGIPLDRPIIGLNTGCGPVFATKAWTPEGFSDLIRRLGVHEGHSLMLLGGTREQALHRRLTAENPGCTVLFDSGNHNSLETFFGLVERCAMVLTSDSLCLHAAVALRRPLVAFFGPTCEQEIDLFGLGEKIVTDFACSPCYLKVCPKPRTCMQALEVGVVESAMMRVLHAAR